MPGYRYRDLDTQDAEACGAMVELLSEAGYESVHPVVAVDATPSEGFARRSCHYVVDLDATTDQVGIIEFQLSEAEASDPDAAAAFARAAVPAMVGAMTDPGQAVVSRRIADVDVTVAAGGERDGSLTTLSHFVDPVVYLVFGDRPGPPEAFVDALLAASR